jgi:hypothetical protein
MVVNSVNSNVANANAIQTQKLVNRDKELENYKDKDNVVSKSLPQKTEVQKSTDKKVVEEKSEAQMIDSQKANEKKAIVQLASRVSVNTRGEIVGGNIDTQA